MEAPPAGSVRNSFVGMGVMMRFILRRNWLRMLVWIVVLSSMVPIVIDSQRTIFPTQADRDAYAHVANTPAIAALTGLPYAAGTLGGILNIKLWMTLAIALSLAVIFLVTRNGRAEEEEGRTELLRSGVLGRHSYSMANWLIFAMFAILAGVTMAVGAISQGLPTAGSLFMGASVTGVALVYLGVAAITNQLARTGRGANSLASSIVAVAYLIRAVADVRADGDHALWITWLSPVGWGQQVRSFGENQWWPLLLSLGAAVTLCGVAFALESRRDVGSGIIPERAGPRGASGLVRSQVGLSLRLQRGSLIGWSIGTLVGALFFGGVAKAMVDLLKPDNPISQAFTGHSTNVIEGLLGFFVMTLALIVAAFALQSTDNIRAEEAARRTELQWSSAISRVRWAVSRMVVPSLASLLLLVVGGAAIGATYGAAMKDSGALGRMTLAAIAYWPSVLLVIGVVVLCAAVIPRVAASVTWALYGVLVLVSMFGDLFNLPAWVTKNTPFTAVFRLGEDVNVLPLIVLTVLAIATAAIGLWVLRERDMTSA